jgi:peroxiredoxin
MKHVAVVFGLVVTIGWVNPASAGKYNRKLSIGDTAPVWKNLPGTDGKNHSLDDLKDKDIVVVVITCNHCPVASAYEDRIVEFANKHAGPESKVALVAINVNTNDEDSLPKMKERAQERGFHFPYLYDQTQQIGRQLGASVTPEFFVFDKDRKVVYMGAMDDDMSPEKVKVHYLEDAVKAIVHGESSPKAETRPFGCGVQYGRR